MSDTTGNTTHPADPSQRRASSPAPTTAIAVAICHSVREPWRIGEVAKGDPHGKRPLYIGREGAAFVRERPGETIETGKLRGDALSREQLEILAEGDGARVHNVGRAEVYVNGTQLPQNCSACVPLPSVIEITGHTVLLLTRRPLSLGEPHRLLLPYGHFGEVDALDLCGESAGMWQLRLDAVNAANKGLHTLILGESGTGKDVVARAIHARSYRAKRAYVKVNCPDLKEGTAAVQLNGGPGNWPNPGTPRTIGPFEDSKGGVVFLDEIGEVPEVVQAILLRALDGTYARVGETRSHPIECVILAATNRPTSYIKHDVYNRFPIKLHTPSLADRREDIPLLIRHLLVKGLRSDTERARLLKTDPNGREYVEVDVELIVNLLLAPPPGNVRELWSILQEAINEVGDGTSIPWPSRRPPPAPAKLDMREEAEHVPVNKVLAGLGKREEPPARRPTIPATAELQSEHRPDPSPALLLQTLRECGWKKTETGKRLGISRHIVHRLIEKHGIRRPD
jgi:DNA-binding NtrC family response regulator